MRVRAGHRGHATAEYGRYPAIDTLFVLGVHAGYMWRLDQDLAVVGEVDITMPFDRYGRYQDRVFGRLRARASIRRFLASGPVQPYLTIGAGYALLAVTKAFYEDKSAFAHGPHALTGVGVTARLSGTYSLYVQGAVHLAYCDTVDEDRPTIDVGMELFGGLSIKL